MRINKSRLEMVLANKCLSLTDLRGELSAFTLTKINNGEGIRPKTVGRIAHALGVDVSEIVESEGEA